MPEFVAVETAEQAKSRALSAIAADCKASKTLDALRAKINSRLADATKGQKPHFVSAMKAVDWYVHPCMGKKLQDAKTIIQSYKSAAQKNNRPAAVTIYDWALAKLAQPSNIDMKKILKKTAVKTDEMMMKIFSDPKTRKLPIYTDDNSSNKLSQLATAYGQSVNFGGDAVFIKLVKGQIDFVAKNTRNPEERKRQLTGIAQYFEGWGGKEFDDIKRYALVAAYTEKSAERAIAAVRKLLHRHHKILDKLKYMAIFEIAAANDANSFEKLLRDSPKWNDEHWMGIATGKDPIFESKSFRIIQKKNAKIVGIGRENGKFVLSGIPDRRIFAQESLDLVAAYLKTPAGVDDLVGYIQSRVDKLYKRCGFSQRYILGDKARESIKKEIGWRPKIEGEDSKGAHKGVYYSASRKIGIDTLLGRDSEVLQHEISHAATFSNSRDFTYWVMSFISPKTVHSKYGKLPDEVDIFTEMMTAAITGDGYSDWQGKFFEYFAKTNDKEGLDLMVSAYFGDSGNVGTYKARKLASKISKYGESDR